MRTSVSLAAILILAAAGTAGQAAQAISPLSPSVSGDEVASNLLRQLDLSIAGITSVTCHEETRRHSQSGGSRTHSGLIATEVRIVGGVEEYSKILLNAARRHSLHSPGGAHSGRITSDVRIVGSVEEYSKILFNGKPYKTVSDIPGAWIEGEFATILVATRRVLAQAFQEEDLTIRRAPIAGAQPLYEVTFVSPAERNAWVLFSNGGSWSVPFSARVIVSADTGEVREIKWDTSGISLPESTGIERLAWTVTFGPESLAGRSVVVPTNSVYQVFYDKSAVTTDWAETRYFGFRRFGSDATVTFPN